MPARGPVDDVTASGRSPAAEPARGRGAARTPPTARTHHPSSGGPRRELLDTLQHRQNRSELHKRVRALHQADIAYVLESLPVDDREMVWDELELQQAAWVFVELSPAVRASLASTMDRQRLIDVLSALDAEDLGYVSTSVPPEVLRHAFRV